MEFSSPGMTECGGRGQRPRPSSQGLGEGQWVWGKRVERCVSCSSGGVWRDLNGLMSLGREGPQHVGEWGLIQVGDTQRPRKGLLILQSQSHFWLTSDGSISLPEHRPGLSLSSSAWPRSLVEGAVAQELGSRDGVLLTGSWGSELTSPR